MLDHDRPHDEAAGGDGGWDEDEPGPDSDAGADVDALVCPRCGAGVSEETYHCPECGHGFTHKAWTGRPSWCIAVGLLWMIAATGAALSAAADATGLLCLGSGFVALVVLQYLVWGRRLSACASTQRDGDT